jgi:predicted ABC-type transport system involved in lysophospholipase L1 biosynthesis ATPase subunit
MTIIMVTHEMDVAMRCERIIRLQDGTIATDEHVVRPDSNGHP